MLTIPPVFDVMLMWSLIIFLYAWVGTVRVFASPLHWPSVGAAPGVMVCFVQLLFLGTTEGTDHFDG